MDIYPPAVPPTREFYWPTTGGTNVVQSQGFVPVINCANGQRARISFLVPYDFTAIVEAVILVIPGATQAAADWDLQANFGSAGQPYTVHTTGEGAVTFNVVAGQLFEVQVANMLALIVAGDRGGVDLLVSTAGHDCSVMGLKLRYV